MELVWDIEEGSLGRMFFEGLFKLSSFRIR